MKLKRLHEFTEKETAHFNNSCWENITYNDEEYNLEIVSSDAPLLTGGEHEFYSQCTIWKGDKLVYHALDKNTLNDIQCAEMANAVMTYPNTFIK